MQHKKDEYIFQLVTRAVKEIDSSEICRKREIFKILAKPEVSLEMKQILAKNAMLISELQHLLRIIQIDPDTSKDFTGSLGEGSLGVDELNDNSSSIN